MPGMYPQQPENRLFLFLFGNRSATYGNLPSFRLGKWGKKFARMGGVTVFTLLIIFSVAHDGIATPTVRRPTGPSRPGQDIITPHQMLAPITAQMATDNAVDALVVGDRDEAMRQVSNALDIFPHYAVALTLRGLIEMNEGRFDVGAADFEEAIRVDPAYAAPRLMLAAYYNDLGRFDDALVLLDRATRLLSSAWQSHFELARALYGKGDYEAALPAATQAIQLAPSTLGPQSRALLHYLRGHILAQLHDSEASKEEFEETLKTDPDGPLANSTRKALELLH